MDGLHSAGEPSEIYQSSKQLFRSSLQCSLGWMAFIRLESLQKYIKVQNNFSDHLCNARWDGWPSFGWRAFRNISKFKTTFQIIFAMLVGMDGLHSAGEPSEIYQSSKQ